MCSGNPPTSCSADRSDYWYEDSYSWPFVVEERAMDCTTTNVNNAATTSVDVVPTNPAVAAITTAADTVSALTGLLMDFTLDRTGAAMTAKNDVLSSGALCDSSPAMTCDVTELTDHGKNLLLEVRSDCTIGVKTDSGFDWTSCYMQVI